MLVIRDAQMAAMGVSLLTIFEREMMARIAATEPEWSHRTSEARRRELVKFGIDECRRKRLTRESTTEFIDLMVDVVAESEAALPEAADTAFRMMKARELFRTMQSLKSATPQARGE